jgi:hypothetical protein
MAAERRDPDFLIGPRNKNNEKKVSRPLKFLFHRSKLQIGTSDVDHHIESQLLHAVTRPRATTRDSIRLLINLARILPFD